MLLSVTACASLDRSTLTEATLAADARQHDARQRALLDASIDRLAKRAARRGDRTLDILLLSGGGQNGA